MLYPLSYEGLQGFGPQMFSLTRTINNRKTPTCVEVCRGRAGQQGQGIGKGYCLLLVVTFLSSRRLANKVDTPGKVAGGVLNRLSASWHSPFIHERPQLVRSDFCVLDCQFCPFSIAPFEQRCEVGAKRTEARHDLFGVFIRTQ
jgi:hypothetical protein